MHQNNQHSQEDDDAMDEEVSYSMIDKLQDSGINAADLKKLKDAGFNTSQAIVFAMRKDLLAIKGLSDQKVDKIIEAARKSTDAGFVTCSQLVQQHRAFRRIQVWQNAARPFFGGNGSVASEHGW